MLFFFGFKRGCSLDCEKFKTKYCGTPIFPYMFLNLKFILWFDCFAFRLVHDPEIAGICNKTKFICGCM